MTGQEKLLAAAQAEIGYLEKATNSNLDSKTGNAGSNNWTKYARDLDNLGDVFNGKKNGYDWCAVFVTWCFVQTFGKNLGQKLLCQPSKSLAAGVRYAANYFKNKGQFRTSGPQPGDQIFFYGSTIDVWQHTGLVEKVEGGKVYTIEGNTTGASGVVYNGGGVARKSYALNYSRIAGYGRPDWTLVKTNAPTPSAPAENVSYQGKVNATAGLNCRTAPVNGTVVKAYTYGTVLTITKEQNGWGYTGEGWVSLEYVTKITAGSSGAAGSTTTNTPTQKEDDNMTYYQKIEDMPVYYQAAVKKAVDKGALKGDGSGLNVSEDLCKTLTILDRLGKLD